MIARYEVQDRIGTGGVSAVYKAYDNQLHRKVALKRLLPEGQSKLNDPTQACLNREAQALARFQHPNVVSVFEFGEDEAGPFAVLELVRGQSMEEIIREGALDYEDFIEIAEQLLDPLVVANDLNMLHRDIKPANIMLSLKPSGRYHVKILDFGMAKFSEKPSIQTVDQKGCFLGSIDFIAPEQVDRKEIDQRADLYSLGCVLYYALTQQRPFASPSLAQTLRNHLAHRVTPLHQIRPDLPREVADWVMHLIMRRPSDRPADARSALAKLREARGLGSHHSIPHEEEEEVAEAASPIRRSFSSAIVSILLGLAGFSTVTVCLTAVL